MHSSVFIVETLSDTEYEKIQENKKVKGLQNTQRRYFNPCYKFPGVWIGGLSVVVFPATMCGAEHNPFCGTFCVVSVDGELFP